MMNEKDRNALLNEVVSNVEKVIIGKKSAIELILCSLLCKGHVLIEDVPGVGKTSLVSALAHSINCSFRRIQFTPDILPSDITGFSMYNQKTSDFEYRQGAIMSQIILADEINRTSPKTQSSLLEVMEEGTVTVDGVTYKVPQPFIVMATQNPVEYLGTYPLPEAQLDRFFMKVSLGYPTDVEEAQMLNRFNKENPLHTLTSVASAEDVISLQEAVTGIHVDQKINRYIVSIVTATRENPDVLLGGSPRASLCLYKSSQAFAMYSGRNFVTPDDVVHMAPHVLKHRILLRQEAKLRKVSAENVVASAISSVSVPAGGFKDFVS